MIFSTLAFSAAISMFGFLMPTEVRSHGYAWDPMSRNAYAHEYGVGSWQASDTLSMRTWNHPGLENGGDTFGACGAKIDDDRRYTKPSEWVTHFGNTVPFLAQATYMEGQDIVIRSILTANHRGHVEMYACTDIDNPTDSCFRNNPLEFVEDLLHGAPKDENYPLRAIIAPPSAQIENADVDKTMPAGENGDLYVHKFRLPQGLYGDEVLLQWFWITANGCKPEGYINYPWPNDSWKPSGSLSNVCPSPYADCSREPGRTDCQDPQIFRNCMEVSIEQVGSPLPTHFPSFLPSLRPSQSKEPSLKPSLEPSLHPSQSKPPVSGPTGSPSLRPSLSEIPTANPTNSPTESPNLEMGCCSQNYRDCHDQLFDNCNQDESSCISCGRYWLPGGAQSGCKAYNEVGCYDAARDIGNDVNDPCCDGLICNNDGANTKCFKA